MHDQVGTATVPRLVLRAASLWPEKEAFVDETRRLTFGELSVATDQLTRALMARGVGKGDRVAIWAPNSIAWTVAALGSSSVGAWLIPVNTRFKAEEAAAILARSCARLVFTVDGFLGMDYTAMLASLDLPDLQEVVTFSDVAANGATGWSSFLAASSSVSSELSHARALSVVPEDVFAVCFTSGTTAAPKGVMLQHGTSIGSFEVWATSVGVRHEHRALGVNPFFHMFGLHAGIIVTVRFGSTLYPQQTFDVDRTLRLITDERISLVAAPPTVFQMLLDHPERSGFDFSSFETASIGSASIPPALVHRVRDELGFSRIVCGYGLTEASGVLCISREGDGVDHIANTSGYPVPGVSFRVVDEDGTALPPGVPGELCVRTPYVMAGYLDDPAATAEAIDPDGYLRTGDVGYFDGTGNVHITDRKKDMYIVGGFNVSSVEVEDKVSTYPGVARAAVVGVPDHRLGTVGMAFLVTEPGAEFDVDVFLAWCRERMANYKVPRFVEVVAALPLSAAGKVLKRELRERGSRRVAGVGN